MDWSIWTPRQVADSIPRLAQLVEARAQDVSESDRQRYVDAIASLLADSPTADTISSRAAELNVLGFTLVTVARRIDDTDERLGLFHAAHELSRAGRALQVSTPLMRQAVNEAVRTIVNREVERASQFQTDATAIHNLLHGFVASAWDSVPPQTGLLINELLFEKLNAALLQRAGDTDFERRLVRDNVETILTIELPSRLEKMRDQWVDIARHVAPTALAIATKATSRPQELSAVLTAVRRDLDAALETASTELLARAIETCEDGLVNNLRLRLDVEAEPIKPTSEVRIRNVPDRFFMEARQLLERNDPLARKKFEDLHYRRPSDPIVKEWLAYSIKRFGAAGDKYEIIELLTDAKRSEYFRLAFSWQALWNLACEMRTLPSSEHDALDVLLPVLETDQHTAGVFKLSLLWALDDEREDVLPRLLARSVFFEAQLLATLYELHAGSQSQEALTDEFKRVNRILRNVDQDFALPHEKMTPDRLDTLTREFVGNSMVLAGVEWFQQRMSVGGERYNVKNWQCLGRLYEESGNKAATWRCKTQEWDREVKSKNITNSRKRSALQPILRWAQQENFQRDALRLLKKDARTIEMSPNDILLWERRLAVSGESIPERLAPNIPPTRPSSAWQEDQGASGSGADADGTIRSLAPTFARVTTADELADKAADAGRLLEATLFRNASTPPAAVAALREVLRLSGVFRDGVDPQMAQELAIRMRDQIGPISEHRAGMPYELTGLIQACERAIQSLAVRVRAVSEIGVAQPSQMRTILARPMDGVELVTRVFTRISNPGGEEAREIQVEIIPSSSHITPLENPVYLDSLAPGQTAIVEFPLEVRPDIETDVELRVQVRCRIGRLTSSGASSGQVHVEEHLEPIPALDRYTTDQPVPIDRSDLFHGRGRELRELAEAFAGGRLLRLNFVNGIRAVGKSSLMNHLGLHVGPDVVPILINIQTVLTAPKMDSVQMVRGIVREAIRAVVHLPQFPPGTLSPPDGEAFRLDPPMVVLDTFFEKLLQISGRQSVLLALDEMQVLVKRIADVDDPLDDGFLSWLRDKIQTRSNILVVCTGSEPYELMRKRYEHEHTVWRNIKPYDVSFVDRDAMERIATTPVSPDGVQWLQESLDRLWDTTEGHPWIVQQIAAEVTSVLNTEMRRTVAPGDIDRAVSRVVARPEVIGLWWNEKQGLVNPTHKQIAYLVLQNQGGSRGGVPEAELIALCKRSGIATSARYIEEMKALEVLTRWEKGAEVQWRIRSAFLERHLAQMMQRELSEMGAAVAVRAQNRPMALLLDWENIKINLVKSANAMPRDKSEAAMARLTAESLGAHLLRLAAAHGDPRQRWVVADWDRPLFSGEQKALKGAGFWTEMAGSDKANASDHVLIEKIHYVLRGHPDIMVYVLGTGDGDYGSVVTTLRENGKDVILWVPNEDSMNKAYKHFLSGPDRISIEMLDTLVLGDESR